MNATAYTRLGARFRRIAILGEAEGVLHWDWSTVMPSGAAGARGDQLAELKAVCHSLITAPDMADLFAEAETEELAPDDRANLAEMRRRWRHQTALSESLVTALSQASTTCETVWRAARPHGDFKAVLPTLTTLVGLVREAAAAKADALDTSLYDALLDEYEPGGTSAEIDAVFGDLESFLPGFLTEVLQAQARRPAPLIPAGPFPIPTQKALAQRFMGVLGFDFDHGRLDESLHPFCGGGPEDVRITTRYDESDFLSGLMGVLHETGHALYERGLPAAWRRSPAGDARGMSLHESQSLLMEMQVCRSRAFLSFAAPIIAEAFARDGSAWNAENLYRLHTRVEPGFIRVDADEVTYPAHVILRYRLEKAIIESAMEPADLPVAWAEGMERLLGIVPPSDREGCLQDIHWYDGAWGYFPTYTLGAISAAQIHRAALESLPDLPDAVARGDFTPLLTWLRANVHGRGSLESTRSILENATGRGLDVTAFKAHLRSRYLD